MEHITEKVSAEKRYKRLLDNRVSFDDTCGVADIMVFIAEQIEQAYLAGYNNINISAGMPRKRIEDTGVPLANARAFVKDKGFRI